MRNILLTAILLTVLLSSCGTLEMRIEDPSKMTPTSPAPSNSASASLVPAHPPLGVNSTSEEIRQTLLNSPYRWQTIFVDAQVTSTTDPSRRVQTWVDQPNLSARVLVGSLAGSVLNMRVSNRMSVLDLNVATGHSTLSPFLDESYPIPYTPVPVTPSAREIISHPLSTAVDPALSTLLFPSDIAQNEGTFKPITTELVAYHLCLVVEWTYINEALPSYRAWVDVSTGVFLRFQQFDKTGGTDLVSEVNVTRVDYDLPYPSTLFDVTVSAMPSFVSDPQTVSMITATPAPDLDTEDPLGMVYSFVMDLSTPANKTRLIRLPASCIVGKADCPHIEEILTPVPLTSSIQPLVWSPTRNEAAWVYPAWQGSNIWTLYLFSGQTASWTELASFDRFVDPPMWSRDGNWLAFRVQDGNGNSEIYAMRRDVNNMIPLTYNSDLPESGAPYVMDSWLGENVVLRSGKPGQNGTIYLVRPEDGRVQPLFETLLTKSPFIESPDGTLLATVDYDYTSEKQLVKILTPDGKTFRELASFAHGSIQELTWSADGKQLAFAHFTDAASSVYVIDSDGRNMRQVYTSATNVHFVFSPDGEYLLVETIDGTGEHLYSIDLSSLEALLVQVPGVALNEAWMYPAWQP
jgi:hypothetical protein